VTRSPGPAEAKIAPLFREPETVGKPEANRGFKLVGETGFEPATPCPERRSGYFDQLAPPGTASHPLDNTEEVRPAHPLNGTQDKPCEAGFVPQVSHDFRAKLLLPEQLLTVRQAAERLNISTASLYKLCAQNQLAYVRVGNAVRFPKEDLAQMIRKHRKSLHE
jgi:excisionase family DNA binding protein